MNNLRSTLFNLHPEVEHAFPLLDDTTDTSCSICSTIERTSPVFSRGMTAAAANTLLRLSRSCNSKWLNRSNMPASRQAIYQGKHPLHALFNLDGSG